MNFRNFKYTRTRRLPNHETETFEAMVYLERDENPDMAFADLKKFVLEKLELRTTTVMQEAFKKAGE